MEKRYFVVHFAENSYSLKEITAEIAESMSLYGMTTSDYCCDDGQDWVFYFMNIALTTKAQRRTIMEELAQGILPRE